MPEPRKLAKLATVQEECERCQAQAQPTVGSQTRMGPSPRLPHRA